MSKAAVILSFGYQPGFALDNVEAVFTDCHDEYEALTKFEKQKGYVGRFETGGGAGAWVLIAPYKTASGCIDYHKFCCRMVEVSK